ncbi:MAG: ATP-binding protein [Desulfuromonadales bacterium]|nr:ATP-binding protein [Desulfuromonadales bacterium]
MTKKYLLIILGFVLVPNLLVWLLADLLLLGKVERIEHEDALRQLVHVTSVIEREGNYLQRWAKVRALRFAEGLATSAHPGAVVADVLPEKLLEAADISIVFVVLPSKEGAVNFSVVGNPGNLDVSEQALSALRLQLMRPDQRDSQAARFGVSWYQGAFLSIAIVPLQTSSSLPGWLLVVRDLNDGTLDRLRDILHANIKVEGASPEFSVELSLPVVEFVDRDNLRVTGLMPGIRGSDAAQVTLLLERGFVKTARQILIYYQICFALIGLVMGVVVVLFIEILEKKSLRERGLSQKIRADAETIKMANERYQLIFDNAPLPIWLVDLDSSSCFDVNPAAISKYGYSREEFLAMNFFANWLQIEPPGLVVHPESPSGLLDSAGLWRHQLKNGTVIDVEIISSQMLYHGRVVRLIIAHDITEQQQLRQGAERVARLAALGELTAGVAHEINNPNGMILRNLDFVGAVLADSLPLLAEQARGENLKLGGLDYDLVAAQIPQLVKDMQRGAGHIRDIVRDMKDFARADEEMAEKSPLDLNEAVAAAVRLLDGHLRKATDRFELQLAEVLPVAIGNTRQIEQVVINLLMNACQSLPDRQHGVTVRTGYDPIQKCIKVEVVDQGRGITSQDMKRITDPFFTTRREEGGTGLGLSVSTRIAKQHGGTLNFKSKPGEGTIVTFSLPVEMSGRLFKKEEDA